jgi:hypothetical protein
METNNGTIEPLFEKVEQYTKTSIELWKLKTIDKVTGISSVLISRLIMMFVLSFFILFISVAMAFYLGNILDSIFYGFLLVASFFGIVLIITLYFHKFMSKQFKNLLIKQFNI